MIKNIEKTIREYLPQVIHMSLATVDNGKPWITEVHFSYDNDLNLYFMSLPTRRHSKEISKNKFVAGNIVTQHSKGEKPRGVYFEGAAKMLTDIKKTDSSYISFNNRFGEGRDILSELGRPDGQRLYMIKVNKFYVFDARESSPSKKYELKWD